MAIYKLAVVIGVDSSSPPSLSEGGGSGGGGKGDSSCPAVAPPMLEQEEYRRYVDSDLWDLPSAPLKVVEDGAATVDLRKFDVRSAIDQIMDTGRMGSSKEPDFGPEPPVHTLFILGKFKFERKSIQDKRSKLSKWISVQSALKLLLEVNPGGDRIGPLFVTMFFSEASKAKWKIPPTFYFQEYPPGVCILPMRSRTIKPFRTTNLLIMTQSEANEDVEYSTCVAHGDALLVDPGCCSEFHAELADIVAALPRKLVVFITHHHLIILMVSLSVIQKCNPDALLLAHENTMNRVGKEAWSSSYIKVSDGDKMNIGGEQLRVIFAPGHTDGHAALLHVSSNSLVVGDHCVGQGSAVLDFRAGGNMKDYFETTYKFLELSPHVLIPMHGRINCWPKSMLCGYLKHRRDRELSILGAIESGAETLFDILAKSYSEVDSKFWFAASSNVRLHVDHLAHQGKLPQGFSHERFLASCRLRFLLLGLRPSLRCCPEVLLWHSTRHHWSRRNSSLLHTIPS
ncbi:unnamed protein product [Spirodela intermedia]|uniref:Metallo-beta-lactamase domain-containing protein n=1 Tax=Spirodela intermedia TaxID=51605 RepID=A0A7I8JNG1_SPIIN|nr:unnamed protein product [Spirodela intermedia]CAA6671325.1 unnamed protein product [Spirodela intermedia]